MWPLGVDPPVLDIPRQADFRPIRRTPLPGKTCNDLALHPSQAVAYVAMNKRDTVYESTFYVCDEQTGEAIGSERYLGAWLKVDPRGKFLITGYKNLIQSGSHLVFNPNQVFETPDYDSVDCLIYYMLSKTGEPGTPLVKENMGGNGQGLRMSRDGARVTYLSFVGYPDFSRNLVGWNTSDLRKLPVNYAVKDRATTGELAYHPSLPIVASPGSGSAVFFDRETGALQDDRLNLPPNAFAGAKVNSIQFSPDGKNLIFHTSVDKVQYLYQVALKLTAKEQEQVEAEFRTREAAGGQVHSGGAAA